MFVLGRKLITIKLGEIYASKRAVFIDIRLVATHANCTKDILLSVSDEKAARNRDHVPMSENIDRGDKCRAAICILS
jgi:hypothetical protein